MAAVVGDVNVFRCRRGISIEASQSGVNSTGLRAELFLLPQAEDVVRLSASH